MILRLSIIRVLFLIVFIFYASKSKGQCLPDSIFRTESIGTKTQGMPFSLIFYIGKDSIWVYNGNMGGSEFASFKIIRKDTCQWNDDFTEGYTTYKLMMDAKPVIKYPLLKVVYENVNYRYIELLYEDNEERIFTIARKPN